MTHFKQDLMQIAKQAEHSCHHAMLAMIHFNLMVDITDWQVSVKGLKSGMIQGVTKLFGDADKEAVVRQAISEAALREVANG